MEASLEEVLTLYYAYSLVSLGEENEVNIFKILINFKNETNSVRVPKV